MRLVCSSPLTKKRIWLIEWVCFLSWALAAWFIYGFAHQYNADTVMWTKGATSLVWVILLWGLATVFVGSGISSLGKQARKAIQVREDDPDDDNGEKGFASTEVNVRYVKVSFATIVILLPLMSGFGALVIHAWSTFHVAIKIVYGVAWTLAVLVVFYGSLLLRATALNPRPEQRESSLT
jgi:hypothetical protein